MIEIPEAAIIARQITEELKGRRIVSAERGNTPHKFAFYSGPPELYAALLPGKKVGKATEQANCIIVPAQPGYALVLGVGGERILYHPDDTTLPKKHHLLIGFEGGAYLSVVVQGWGSLSLLPLTQLDTHFELRKKGVSPLSEEFTWDYFKGLFEPLEKEDARSVKFFIISEPGVRGVGNGCLQDILFRARIHPRRRVVELSAKEKRALYKAVSQTLEQMVKEGGRDSELDLYGKPGNYRRILDSKSAGKPCPECGTRIKKEQFLGGAVYFCPKCQV